jgi:hypothetical protein
MKYNVGQTIFAMLKKQKQVIPVLVVEELTRKRVDGESFTYTVQLPDNKNTQVQLDKLDAVVFDTIDAVKESMLNTAAQTIEKIIVRAEKIKTEFFPHQQEEVDYQKEVYIPENDKGKIDSMQVDLGNGVKGKLDISSLKQQGII